MTVTRAVSFMLVAAALVAASAAWTATVRADSPTPVPGARTMTDPTQWLQRPPDGPSQEEHGAFVYWMRCMVCHGDQGQGLAKFRSSYPPQEQNCSAHGCHNDPHAGAGFTFPDAPAIIGVGTLTGFSTAQDLYNFVSKRMPYQAPGDLSSADYWAVTAFLLQKHGLSVSNLNAGNASFFRLSPGSGFPVAVPAVAGGAIALAGLAFLLFRRHGRP